MLSPVSRPEARITLRCEISVFLMRAEHLLIADALAPHVVAVLAQQLPHLVVQAVLHLQFVFESHGLIISVAVFGSLVSMICGVIRDTSCLDRYAMNSRLSSMLEIERSVETRRLVSILAHSVGPLALMLVEKLPVDGFPPTKSFLNAVPEVDAGFAQLPAKIDFFAAQQRWEIDQTDVQILH